MFTYIMAALNRLILFLALSSSLQSEFDKMQPGRDHAKLAHTIAQVALSEPLLPVKAWASPQGTSALLGATVRQESSLGLQTVGDGGHSYGISQIYGRPDLEDDDAANLREAWRQIRVSFEMCPDEPFSAYLSGRCLDGTVARQSRSRVKLAGRILEGL